MNRHRNIRKARHQALAFLGALLLAVACSVVRADPLVDSARRDFEPARVHGIRSMVIALAPAAQAVVRMQNQSRREGARELMSMHDQPVAREGEPASELRAPQERAPQEQESPSGFKAPWVPYVNTISPKLALLARNYHRDGAPIVRLWNSDSNQSVLALGVNPHGVPGLYFTSHIPD